MIYHQGENLPGSRDDWVDYIEDEAESDETVVPVRYDITSFGIDFDVDGLVRRLNSEDITIPIWQRLYVWSMRQASSFVESLLFGLPVPGIFLGRDENSGQLYVIDGQQRLKTLQFFFNGEFLGRPGPFRLVGVAEQLEGIAYGDLKDSERRNLSNSLIHATVVRQDSPDDNDTSMYQIFKRLNSGAIRVTPQEIRSAVYQGELINALRLLNENADWRGIIGRPSRRLKDQEMILRFLAMFHQGNQYSKPMSEFLNAFTLLNRNPDVEWLRSSSDLFRETISTFAASKERPFRLRGSRQVNVAVFEAMTVGLAKRIYLGRTPSTQDIAAVHDSLLDDPDFIQSVVQGTSDEASVARRITIASDAFRNA